MYKKNYVFGMIYKWTNTKSGEFGYEVDMSKVGRTEQKLGTNRYPPVSGISRRFESYLRKAIRPQSIYDINEGTIEYDMRSVYDDAGGSLAGEKAIINTFKLEIVEIMFISESYSQDKRVIEQLEDFYINRFGTHVPTGYNIASGASGAHVAEEKGGHGTKEFVRVLDHLISHGFEFIKLADYFGMSETSLREWIKATHSGEGFSELQTKFIEEKIRELVYERLILPKDLEPYFKDLDCDEVFLYMKKVDNGELLRGIIATLISMGIAHIDSGYRHKYVSYEPLAEYMGLSKASALSYFIQKEIDETLFDLDLDLYLRPLAWYMIESSTDALDLLESIGWGLSATTKSSRRWQFEVNQRIQKLFGMTYERAKILSTISFIGDFI